MLDGGDGQWRARRGKHASRASPRSCATVRTAAWFPPGDASALADALVELATDPALRDRLGRAARATAVRDFDVEANAARLIDRIRAAA